MTSPTSRKGKKLNVALTDCHAKLTNELLYPNFISLQKYVLGKLELCCFVVVIIIIIAIINNIIVMFESFFKQLHTQSP